MRRRRSVARSVASKSRSPRRRRLEVAGEKAALPEILAGLEPTLRIAGEGEPDAEGFHRLTLVAEREADLGEALVRVLAGDSRFRVRALSRDHPTLEDVFLAATKRSWDVTDRSGSPRKTPLPFAK